MSGKVGAVVQAGVSVEPFFTVCGDSSEEVLTPMPAAAGNWGAGRMRGMAVSGALARAVERVVTDGAFRPVRWTLDLCRVATLEPFTVHATVVRAGRRLCLVEGELVQEGSVVARARALFLKPPPDPGRGKVWTSADRRCPPPPNLAAAGREPRLYFSEGVGWTGAAADHHNAERKQSWLLPIQVLDGEQTTPFQYVASVADVASMVANWGDAGVEYINADVTLALTRLPVDLEVGLAAVERTETEGISVGTVAVFDREGSVGTVAVCALANAGRSVDPGAR
jgi:hypothetical protein